MASSSIPTFKANLKTQLSARGGLSGTLISYGPPTSGADQYVWLGDAQGRQEQMSFGTTGQARMESYELQVVICVERQGTGMQNADEQCFTLFAELEAQLRTDPTVNGAVNRAQVGGFKLSEIPVDGMVRISQLEVQVECQAVI